MLAVIFAVVALVVVIVVAVVDVVAIVVIFACRQSYLVYFSPLAHMKKKLISKCKQTVP